MGNLAKVRRAHMKGQPPMGKVRLSHCAALAKQHDHDRYLTALLAPADRREDLFALIAFNYEVARTAEAAHEAAMGYIRLQWWREVLAGIDTGDPRTHPVAEALAGTIVRRGLDRQCLARLLHGREQDLAGDPPADLAALEDYAEATSATLAVLALEILGARTPDTEAVGRDIGIAWALTGLLRAVPFHARQRRIYLPRDLCESENLDIGRLFEMRTSDALGRVAAAVAARARERLQSARATGVKTPAAAWPALALGVLATRALVTLERVGFDTFHPDVQRQDPGRAWRLAWAKLRGQY